MKRVWAAAVLVSMAVVAQPAGADHAWSTYHWSRAANPFTLTVVDSVSTDWDAYLATAVADWSTGSDVIDLVTETGASDDRSRRKCAAIRGKIRVCNQRYGFNGWLGLAQIWLYGGHIVQGVAKMNDSYFMTGTYNDASAKQHVMCQEVGHDFGLGHQYTEPSCMDDRNGLFDPAYIHPAAHDWEQLQTIYNAHLDAAAQAAPSGPGNSGDHAPDDLEWDSHGYTVITWIFWA